MKIVQIVVLLATVSTVAHSAQPPQAAAPKVHRELSANSQGCCVGCTLCLLACCLYYAVSDQAKMQGEMRGLQATSYGRMVIKHLKQEGAKEGYQKGLIAGQTSCPTSPLMNREEDESDFHTCVCPSSLTVVRVKKNN